MIPNRSAYSRYLILLAAWLWVLPSWGQKPGYGIGWSVSTDAKGRLLLGHTGGSVGGTSIFQMNPEHNVVVALTINQSSASLAIGRSLMQYFLDALEEGE
jgi:CubicO group peptidase (beta-lactamase class C family)